MSRAPSLRRWLAAGCAALAVGGAAAQDTVRGPVRLLVPLAAGSTSDTVARLLADPIARAVGQPVVIVNKPGASGRIAAAALKGAPPDGTTLMLAPIAVTVLNPLLHRRLDYDPRTDFAPIAHVATFRIAIAVGPAIPATTLQEFIAWAKAHPAQASFGTPGTGGLPHLFGVKLAQASGAALTYVPYNGGAQVAADAIGGQLAADIDAVSTLIELHRAGKLRILAVSGTERSPELPAVATFAEQGFAGLDGTGWLALYAPAATPRAVIAQVSLAVGKALQSGPVREALMGLALDPTGSTPEGLSAIMAADALRWAPVIAASGLAVE